MDMATLTATLAGGVAYYDGVSNRNPIRVGRKQTKKMQQVASSCQNLASTFAGGRTTARIPMPDWRALPPCF